MLLPAYKQPDMLRIFRSCLLENAREDIGRSYWSKCNEIEKKYDAYMSESFPSPQQLENETINIKVAANANVICTENWVQPQP